MKRSWVQFPLGIFFDNCFDNYRKTNKRQTSKKNCAFSFAFVRSDLAFRLHYDQEGYCVLESILWYASKIWTRTLPIHTNTHSTIWPDKIWIEFTFPTNNTFNGKVENQKFHRLNLHSHQLCVFESVSQYISTEVNWYGIKSTLFYLSFWTKFDLLWNNYCNRCKLIVKGLQGKLLLYYERRKQVSIVS